MYAELQNEIRPAIKSLEAKSMSNEDRLKRIEAALGLESEGDKAPNDVEELKLEEGEGEEKDSSEKIVDMTADKTEGGE